MELDEQQGQHEYIVKNKLNVEIKGGIKCMKLIYKLEQQLSITQKEKKQELENQQFLIDELSR